MEVRCRTNLDLRGEKWPTELPAVPAIGDHIESGTLWPGRDGSSCGFRLRLKVVAVTWVHSYPDGRSCSEYDAVWIPEIELHMPSYCAEKSIREFYEWYAPKVGKSVGYFI